MSYAEVSPDISRILAYTDILAIIFQILSLEAKDQIFKYI